MCARSRISSPSPPTPTRSPGRLAQTLLEHDLIDELRLMIDPVLLGGGKGIFREDGQLRPLRLVEHTVTPKGAILATYARDRS